MFPAPGPYVMQKGDVPRGAGLAVQVLDHVELDYEPPSGYGATNTGMKTFAGSRGVPARVDKIGYRL